MKKIICFKIILFVTWFMPAQTVYQEGKTRELNSKNKPITGVFIKFEDATSVSSDANGNFQLTFQDKNKGDIVFLQDIKKTGYELVNFKEFEVTTITNSDRLIKDMILAKIGVVDAARKEYYGVSDQALILSFKKEKSKLKLKLKEAELSQQDYLYQLQKVQEQYDLQKKSLSELSEKFARINFDDVAPIYQKALELFKKGDIINAIATLESTNSAQKTIDILIEEKRITSAQTELKSQKERLLETKRNQIAAVSLLADMYNVNFNSKKAENQYDQLIALDSTDYEILEKAANFYRTQHLYEKAKKIYHKILKHPKAKAWQVGKAYTYLAGLNISTGNLLKALKENETSLEIYQKLQQESPTSFYKSELANSKKHLGLTYKTLGNIPKAMFFLKEFKVTTEELYNQFPDNPSYKEDLAIAYEKLGSITSASGDLTLALSMFEKGFVLANELNQSYPQNIHLKNNLAIIYFFLGATHNKLENLELALEYFEKDLKMNQELLQERPNNVVYKQNLGFANQSIGIIHSKKGDLKTALTYFEQYLNLEEEISNLYPLNVKFKEALGISLSYVGQTYYFLGELSKSLIYYEKGKVIFEELHKTDPINTEFKLRLANAYKDYGWSYFYLKNYEESLKYFKNYNKLDKELYEKHPENIAFRNSYAISCQTLGRVYWQDYDYINALEYYEIYHQHEKELHKLYPEIVSYKQSLAISYENLGHTHSELGNIKKALNFYIKELKLFKELSTDYVLNLRYKNAYAMTYAIIADFYEQYMKDNENAILNYKKSEILLIELVRDAPETPKYKGNLKIIREDLEKLSNN